MTNFAGLEFRKFNPYYKLDSERNDKTYAATFETGSSVKSIFDNSNAFSQMFYQFNLFTREQIKIK